MIISDLKYLQTTNKEVFGGLLPALPPIKLSASANLSLRIFKKVRGIVDIQGNMAGGAVVLSASGKNTWTDAIVESHTKPNQSITTMAVMAASN